VHEPVEDARRLTVGGLFSGIGGIELGLERAGMQILWHAESDPFCQHVLAERWPGVPCFPDVRDLVADTHGIPAQPDRTAGRVAATTRGDEGTRQERQRVRHPADGGGETGLPVRVPYVDVLCGGFPCQDISLAGAGAGIAEGTRSGLWYEFARLIRDIRPRYVIVENVSALLARGLDIVLGDLAACGYDAEWDCIPASAVGAPHRRDRVWIVAYPNGEGSQGYGGPEPRSGERVVAQGGAANGTRAGVADTASDCGRSGLRASEPRGIGRGRPRDVGSPRDAWAVEPDVGRVAHGIPARVDRLRSLGNAVIPQIAEWIGSRIVAYEAEVTSAQEMVLR
jgi:DNA (cytosine-5)-methyltransferase 1